MVTSRSTVGAYPSGSDRVPQPRSGWSVGDQEAADAADPHGAFALGSHRPLQTQPDMSVAHRDADRAVASNPNLGRRDVVHDPVAADLYVARGDEVRDAVDPQADVTGCSQADGAVGAHVDDAVECPGLVGGDVRLGFVP